MGNIYTNMDREQKIIKHALNNHLAVTMQLVTENAIMFTVLEKDLEPMKKFCEEQFELECNVVEDLGDFVMCKVKT